MEDTEVSNIESSSPFPVRLRCPTCHKGELILTSDSINQYLCLGCDFVYPQDSSVPVLLTEEARKSLKGLIDLNEADRLEHHTADARVHDKEVYLHSGYLDRFLHEVNIEDRDIVLDLGCGRGQLSEYMAEHTGGTVISIDIVMENLFDTDNDFKLCASGDNLPFWDDTFDKVILTDVLEHIPPAMETRILSEIFRCLRHGGVLYLSYPGNNIPNVIGFPILNLGLRILRIFDSRIRLYGTKEPPAHINMTYPYRIRKRLKEAGFEGKVRPYTDKFMSIPERYHNVAKIANIFPFNYLVNKQIHGMVRKPEKA